MTDHLPVPQDRAPEPAGGVTLVDALRLALAKADDQRQALADAGDIANLAYGLTQLKVLADDLRTLLRDVEANVADLMDAKLVELPEVGITLERKRGTDRRSWDSMALLQEVIRRSVDPDGTGELPPVGEVIQRLHDGVSACVPVTGSLGWRVGALRAIGLDPDEWCETSPGRTSVIVRGGEQS